MWHISAALREFVGTLDIEKKETIAHFILKEVYAKGIVAGVESAATVSGILYCRDKDILNQVLIAEKKSQANIIMRKRRNVAHELADSQG